MTDKELISIVDAKAKKLWDEINTGHEYSIIESYNQFYGICMEIAEMVQEEPVSEDLEEACEQLAENARKHKAETSSPFFSQTDYRQGVIDGAKWQKEKDQKK